MKKFIGMMLALMLAVTGLALAETVAKPVETAEGYLLVRFEYADDESLALIGSGDGTDAFDAFASDDDTYAERFEDFWKTLSLLEPTLELQGSIANLGFESSLDHSLTMVTLNGVVVAQLKGLETFAIVSGEEQPTIDEDCTVRVWAKAGTGDSICPNCGQIHDGSAKHDTLISEFCDEGHTVCMGDPIHHCDECGKDYPCSKSNSHTTCAVCGRPWCDKSEGDHVELECGHRGCEVYGEEDEHAKCETCGGYLCDGEDHEHPDELPDEGDDTNSDVENGTEEDTSTESDAKIPEGEVTIEGDASASVSA